MDTQQILRVIALYRETFKTLNIPPKSCRHDKVPKSRRRQLAHCHGMLEKMEAFLEAGRLEKTFRWLGFIQGVLFAHKIFTLDELKNHNRSDSS